GGGYTFSFYQTKNLFGLGDGGLIAVRDAELAERLRMLRFHGSKAKRTFQFVGYNSRLDEVQAAMLRIFLRHLDEWTRLRREAAERYRELGLGDVVETPEDEPGHVYHLFVSRSPDRDRIVEALREAQIGCALLIALAWRLTFWLRFDQTIPPFYKHLLSWQVFAIVVPVKLVVFTLFGFYNRWWRYVSTRDMWGAARGVVVASLLVDLVLY